MCPRGGLAARPSLTTDSSGQNQGRAGLAVETHALSSPITPPQEAPTRVSTAVCVRTRRLPQPPRNKSQIRAGGSGPGAAWRGVSPPPGLWEPFGAACSRRGRQGPLWSGRRAQRAVYQEGERKQAKPWLFHLGVFLRCGGGGRRVLAPGLHLASQRLLSCRVAPPKCPLLLSHRHRPRWPARLGWTCPPRRPRSSAQGEKAQSGVGPPVHSEG